MYPDDSLTLHTDLYQINMMQVYFDQGIFTINMQFSSPFKRLCCICCGLGRIVEIFGKLEFF